MAVLSTATDLSMGQPIDHALTTCVVAMRLGDALGFDDAQLHDVYYESLLRYIGCNAETTWMASLVGDELVMREAFSRIDSGSDAQVIGTAIRVIRKFHANDSAWQTTRAVFNALRELPATQTSFFPGHCDVARQLATRLGFPARFVDTVGQLYARWDGKGVPSLAGDAIAPAFLCAALAQDGVVFHRLAGVAGAVAMARQRRGTAHAPAMVDAFVQHAERIFGGLDREPTWDMVQKLEPSAPRLLDDAGLDNAFQVFADFGDLKSPWFLNHSHRVSRLAERAAQISGMSPSSSQMLRRAALVHDIGKVGVSSAIWAKSAPLTDAERIIVRRHPYDTGRIFGRSEALGSIGALAALHHELQDGSGYHRHMTAEMLSPAARLLVAANAMQSLCDARPHRPAVSLEQASAHLTQSVRDGKLDADAVRVVCDAAHANANALPSAISTPTATPLTEREREVLVLVARGRATKQIAADLAISYKTADRHIQNLYVKIGVNTRAAATMFAVRQRMV